MSSVLVKCKNVENNKVGGTCVDCGGLVSADVKDDRYNKEKEGNDEAPSRSTVIKTT